MIIFVTTYIAKGAIIAYIKWSIWQCELDKIIVDHYVTKIHDSMMVPKILELKVSSWECVPTVRLCGTIFYVSTVNLNIVTPELQQYYI